MDLTRALLLSARQQSPCSSFNEQQEEKPMQCPIDGTQLVMADRSGVEIDYCPQCRGVWLDRGELDKIIERSVAPPPPPQQAARPASREYDDHEEYDDRPRRKKKRESFLSDIFDF
jgi:Zn-finger nucleic acid-binding protein